MDTFEHNEASNESLMSGNGPADEQVLASHRCTQAFDDFVRQQNAGWLVLAILDRQARPAVAAAQQQTWSAAYAGGGTKLQCLDSSGRSLITVTVNGDGARLSERTVIAVDRLAESITFSLVTEH